MNSNLTTIPNGMYQNLAGTIGGTGTGYGNFAQSFDNWFTGNLDWERQLYLSSLNFAESQRNRDWQEYMSNTSYQRMVKDMTLAGLNPYLAYNQGGSSTPSGSTAHSSSSSGRSGQGFSSLVSLAGIITSASVAMRKIATAQSLKLSDIALSQRGTLDTYYDAFGENLGSRYRRYR